MKIPWQSLSQPTLVGLVQEYVSREGTEYGFEDVPLETKVAQVVAMLQAEKAEILYDDETQTTTIAVIDDAG
jgi:uncharacterized protein YheU (UPF0270 family)